MSGIYGVYIVNNEVNLSEDGFTNLGKWNLAYGDRCETLSLDKLKLGACINHITNAPLLESPVVTYNDYRAVIDAILYNRSELIEKGQLSGELSDEELLLQYVVKNGFDSLKDVNGDFSGAVYDTKTEELTLFRDHMGVRPLFYYSDGDWVAFSTDMRGIMSIPETPTELNAEWLYRIVGGFDETDYCYTEFENVFFLKPASYITFKKAEGGFEKSETIYWKLGTKKVRMTSEKAYIQKLREVITESVKRRVEVFPDIIGAELSGGLDSGVIDILINRLGRKGVYYSWSFSPEDLPLVPDDERQVIADICEQEGIECLYGAETMNMGPESTIGKSHMRIGLEPDWNLGAEYNYALPSYINTLIICETAQLMQEHGAKVVFSGHGGDEGVSHRCDPFEMLYHKEYWHFFKYMYDQNKGKRYRIYKALRQCYSRFKQTPKYLNTPFQDGTQSETMLRADFRDKFDPKKMPVLTFAFDSIRYMYSGNTQVRPNVAALLGAYSGAQYIFPYLDYRVVDYAVSIPRHLYIKGNQKRYIFRKAFQDMMPLSLYTCTAKNNPSTAHMDEDKPKPSQEERDANMNRYRDFRLGKLDRKMWEKYLDFEVLDAWAKKTSYTDEEAEQYLNYCRKLDVCLHHQYLINHVKNMR